MNWRDGLIASLLALLIWFGANIVRLENERYAYSLEMCRVAGMPIKSQACIAQVQTRTSWIWHLAYGLRLT